MYIIPIILYKKRKRERERELHVRPHARFGNNIMQITHAIKLGLQTGCKKITFKDKTIYLPKSNKTTKNFSFITKMNKSSRNYFYIDELKKRKNQHPLDVIGFLKSLISFMGLRNLHSDFLAL